MNLEIFLRNVDYRTSLHRTKEKEPLNLPFDLTINHNLERNFRQVRTFIHSANFINIHQQIFTRTGLKCSLVLLIMKIAS
jgi:hypothetical protein